MQISWTADHLGGSLQTKSVNVAAPSRWFPYPGSMGLTSAIIPVNNVAVNGFYRLVYPPAP